MGGAFALDMGAILLMAQARGIDTEMVADVLPTAQACILAALHENSESD